MIWFIILLILIAVLLFFFVMGKLLISVVRENDAFRLEETVLGEFDYTNDEWAIVYRDQFVDDDRGRGAFNKYPIVISERSGEFDQRERKIQFTNHAIYLFGDGVHKTFRLRNLVGVSLLSTRILHLEPMKRYEVKVNVDYDVGEGRVDFDCDYLISLPASSNTRIDEIDSKIAVT